MTHANSSGSPDVKLGLVSRLGAFALIVAIVALIAVAVIMFGAKLGLWEPLQGFVLYRTYFNPIAYTVTALALVALVVHLIRRDCQRQSKREPKGSAKCCHFGVCMNAA
ncbi:hypothetical protein [Salipiger aestuarii]|uniref:hypothetical protein n=1 Tax=Salipiger aestuarii TaxID=568098 RepID=UPI0016818C55|nr:hypothetical protein [Salipiger aestuarii]